MVKTGERQSKLNFFKSLFLCCRISLHFDDTFDSMYKSSRKVADFDNNAKLLIMV